MTSKCIEKHNVISLEVEFMQAAVTASAVLVPQTEELRHRLELRWLPL
jgi:hypothetical protein